MIPPMVQKGYDKGFVASIVAAGAVIGPIIPPSILMVLYCTVTGISVGAAFLSGVIPGIIMGLCLMVVVYLYARKNPHVDNDTFGVKVSFKEFFQITKSASFALSVPLVIIGGIVLGIFTATEAAAVAIFLAFFGGLFLYKELKLSRIVKILADAARVSSGIMMVVGMAATISWVLSVNQFPLALVNFISSLTDSPRMIILLVIALLVFLGTFIDSPAVVLIFVPVLAPLTAKYGINEVHFAIVCVMTIHIGAITPPVGMLLYISSSMTGIRLSQTFRHLLPCFLALMVATLITALLPEIPLFLPKLFNLIE
jgi:C4-dicarboxylate transporter DctM subunit